MTDEQTSPKSASAVTVGSGKGRSGNGLRSVSSVGAPDDVF